jgi:hypothetical protein
MQQKTILVNLIAFLFLTFSLQSQEPTKAKRVYISDIYINGGFSIASSIPWTNSDFIQLAPQSPLAGEDLSGFTQNNFSMYSYYGNINRGSNSQLNVLLGIGFNKKDGSTLAGSPQLRIGISYRSENALSGSMFKETRFAADTLISPTTGTTYYMDSVHSQYFNMNHFVQHVQLDASLVYRTNPLRRASLFGGIGLLSGVGLNPTTEIIKQVSRYTSLSDGNNGYQTTGESDINSYRTRNKMAFGTSLYLPIGVDLKFSTKHEFWKRVHWTFEMRPAVNLFFSQEAGLFTRFSSYQGMGLKFKLN